MSLKADLVAHAVRYAGGEAESVLGGGLFAVLPPGIAREAGLAESLEVDGGEFDPAMVAAAEKLLGAGGRREVWHAEGLYLKRTGLAERVAREFTALNGVLRPGAPQEVWAAFDTRLFRYSAVSEESEEGTVAVAADTLTGSAVPGLAEALAGVARSGDPAPEAAPSDAAAAFEAAAAEAKRVVGTRLAPFVASLKRRCARDERRLVEYYGGLQSQLERRRRGRRAADLESKREAVSRELDRKLKGLDVRYALNVSLEVVSVSRAVLPVVAVPVTAVRRRTERRLTVVWNPVIKALEPAVCAACMTPVTSFHLCDAAAHCICADCAARTDLRRSCPACSG
ncbi:MAG: hypothetical protein ACYTKD_06620 [Planctomycetota bacterium]|jgi:hypothetical protein